MSSALITTLLSAQLLASGATRFVQTNSNLTFNSLLLDFGFQFLDLVLGILVVKTDDAVVNLVLCHKKTTFTNNLLAKVAFYMVS